MKGFITREWCLRKAQTETGEEIGAGLTAIDPIIESQIQTPEDAGEASIAFGRFVQLKRRAQKLSIEALAEAADVDISELVSIEEDRHFKPGTRTVHQLAKFFNVPSQKLLQISGLASAKDDGLTKEAVKFAARSESLAALTPEEKAALDAFLKVLSQSE